MPRKKEGRAAQGAGTIRQRANGSWEARYTLGRDPATGKQIQKSVYGKSQAEMRCKLAQITVEIDGGTYQDPSRLKVGEWLDIWEKEYLVNLQPTTRRAYERNIENHLIPKLGGVDLQKLKPHQVQMFYNKLGDSLAPKTIRNIHGILHKAMAQAVTLGYIRTNPAEGYTLPKKEKYEIHPLDQEQIPAFLEAARGDNFYSLYVVDLFTGLRLSEIIGLTWDCIDFEAGTIYVRRQLHKLVGTYQWGPPKHGKKCTIAPATSVMAILKDVRTGQLEERLAAGSAWQNEDGFVFTNPLGIHYAHATVREYYKRIVNTIGLPELRFHNLCHSYAVASIQAGDDIKTVQENLGHHSAAFTLDTYAHVTDAMHKNSSERMNDFITQTLGKNL
ncbi:tyrosine-type recombinase/integrase [Eubacterium aggregans]|uniref:tyrosine-type recombinase/integrase n=1 Tax=Eubacterium aggregans TaxID=81409 RepID=UPI003F2FD61E